MPLTLKAKIVSKNPRRDGVTVHVQFQKGEALTDTIDLPLPFTTAAADLLAIGDMVTITLTK